MEDTGTVLQGRLLKKGGINPNACEKCGKVIPTDERINHDGRIVCGHCFVSIGYVKPEPKVEDSIPIPGDETMIQMMELLVSLDDRLSVIEERLDQLDVQFSSICG